MKGSTFSRFRGQKQQPRKQLTCTLIAAILPVEPYSESGKGKKLKGLIGTFHETAKVVDSCFSYGSRIVGRAMPFSGLPRPLGGEGRGEGDCKRPERPSPSPSPWPGRGDFGTRHGPVSSEIA
jgi:hypothetical protein